MTSFYIEASPVDDHFPEYILRPISRPYTYRYSRHVPPEASEKESVAPPPPLYRRSARDALFAIEPVFLAEQRLSKHRFSSFVPPDQKFQESDSETLQAIEPPLEEKDEDETWVTGWRLTSLMVSITLACFLLLLDMSIIVTVRIKPENKHAYTFLTMCSLQAIPIITTDFSSLHDVGWYGSAYNLAW